MADTKTDNLNRDFIVECAVGYSLSDLAEAINPSHSRSKRKAPERPPDLAPARPPRLLTERESVAYVGIDLATFRTWVSVGRLPAAMPDCGKWDVKAIDAALDRISGIGSPTNALDAWRARNARAS